MVAPNEFAARIPEVISPSWEDERTSEELRMVGHIVVPHCVTTGPLESAQQLAVGYGFPSDDRYGIPGWLIMAANIDPEDHTPPRCEKVLDYPAEWRGGAQRRPGDRSTVRNAEGGLFLRTSPDASGKSVEVVFPLLAGRTAQVSQEAIRQGFVRLNDEVVSPFAVPDSLAKPEPVRRGIGKRLLGHLRI